MVPIGIEMNLPERSMMRVFDDSTSIFVFDELQIESYDTFITDSKIWDKIDDWS